MKDSSHKVVLSKPILQTIGICNKFDPLQVEHSITIAVYQAQ